MIVLGRDTSCARRESGQRGEWMAQDTYADNDAQRAEASL
jgi:hypothetical protein